MSLEDLMIRFRAKVYVECVTISETCETVTMRPVTNGTPEDNSYSKYTPHGAITLTLTNPNLLRTLRPGMKFYVDFESVLIEKTDLSRTN